MGTQREVTSLDPDEPSLEVPQSGEGYLMPADLEIAPDRAGAAYANIPYVAVFSEPTTNLVVNPKFAANITDGWGAYGTALRTLESSGFLGSKSLKIVTQAANSGVISATMPVSANTHYIFSAWIKGAAGGETLQFAITGDNSGTVKSDSNGLNTPGVTTVWKRYRWQATSNASDTTMTVRIACIATAKTIYVDGVQFEAKPANADTGASDPSPYCDGSLGAGHSWAGTADNSASSRTGGLQILSTMTANGLSGLAIRPDGTIAGKLVFRSDRGSFNAALLNADEPGFDFEFIGDMETALSSWGIEAGILRVENGSNGIASYVKSAVTTDSGSVFDFSSLTTGAGLVIYAPEDLTAMVAGDGKFLKFSGKAQGADIYQYGVEYIQQSNPGNLNAMAIRMYGGGGMTATDSANKTGLVASSSGSPTITGSGGAVFLTEYLRGDQFQWQHNGTLWQQGTILSIESQTSLTLTANSTVATSTPRAHRSKTRQYKPARIQLEGNNANHHNEVADHFYEIYPSGPDGQLHVLKSATIGATAGPTANGQGNALVTKKFIDSTANSFTDSTDENVIVEGYTLPGGSLGAGSALRITFAGQFTATTANQFLTFRVKLGGTTLVTGIGSYPVAGDMNFRGVVDIVGVTTTSQKTSISVLANRDAGFVFNYSAAGYAASAVDLRASSALTITSEQQGASDDISCEYSYVELL